MEKFEFNQDAYKEVVDQTFIYDGAFDDRFIMEVDEELNKVPYSLTNIANRKTFPYGQKGSHRLIGATLFERRDEYNVMNRCPNEILDIYKHTINRLITPEGADRPGINTELKSISVNVQPMGQDGTPHRDGQYGGPEWTLMYFANAKWDEKWGGNFQILYPDTEEVALEVEFVPGRIVFFQGGLLHRGLAPKKVPYVYRKSVVYRTRIR